MEKIIKRIYTTSLFYTKEQAQALKAQRDVLMQRYGFFVTNAAQITGIDLTVFQSIIVVENGQSLDINYVSSVGAVGLTQITPNTATDTLFRMKKANRITEVEKDALKRKGIDIDLLSGNAPKAKNGKPQKWYSSAEGSIVSTDQLKDVETNLIMGAMYLSELMAKYTEPSLQGLLVRIDKVIVAYNQGFNYNVPMGTTAMIMKRVPIESKNYISKMTGINGMLDTLSRV